MNGGACDPLAAAARVLTADATAAALDAAAAAPPPAASSLPRPQLEPQGCASAGAAAAAADPQIAVRPLTPDDFDIVKVSRSAASLRLCMLKVAACAFIPPQHILTTRALPTPPPRRHRPQAAHAQLFPIDYDDGFFRKATHGLDRIFSWGAFAEFAVGGGGGVGAGGRAGGGFDDGGSSKTHSLNGSSINQYSHPYNGTSISSKPLNGSSNVSDHQNSSSGLDGWKRGAGQQLVGFITARVVRLHECDTQVSALCCRGTIQPIETRAWLVGLSLPRILTCSLQSWPLCS
jgi:hypothetical protein